MMMHLPQRQRLIVLLIFAMLIAAAVAVTAQDVRYPTYEYYGQVLSADEFLELVEQETPLHCVQIPSLESYLSDRAPVDFTCFHTLDEADTYSEEVVPKEWERFSQEHSMRHQQ